MSNDVPAVDGHFPIREVSRHTGVNSVTLRAWERRYGIIKPHRTPKGHRYYTQEHLQQIERILYWLDQDYPIRQIKALLQGAANDGVGKPDESIWQTQTQALLDAVKSMKMQHFNELVMEGLANYPATRYCQNVMLPALNTVRTVNFPHDIRAAFEFTVKRKFNHLIHQLLKSMKLSPELLLVTRPLFEIEAMMLVYALATTGKMVHFYGSDYTAKDAARLVTLTQAKRVWIYGAPCNQDERQQWQEMVESMDADCFVSGFTLEVEHLTGVVHADSPEMVSLIKQYQSQEDSA